MAEQDEEVLKQIEREVRMQEGAGKLLAACSRRDQALEASKSLLTCNARILALLSQLQRLRKAQVLQREGLRPSEDAAACLGNVSLSDLRIPLMWKDSEYFKNKGELQRCAVFCLFQSGTQIYDTDLLMVDRTLTDICFEDAIVLKEVGPGFQLLVELYSCCVVDDFSPGSSLGRSSGKKLRAAFESATVCGSVSGDEDAGAGNTSAPSAGLKFSLLAHATLRMQHVHDGFKTHDLSVAAAEDSPFWLPLYGNMCCRLAAQPHCMIQPVASGRLRVKLGEELNSWRHIYGVLRGPSLLCYGRGAEPESEDEPLLIIPIREDTLVCVSEADPDRCQSINIRTRRHGEELTYAVTASAPGDTQQWAAALWEHVYNMGQWKQCCDHLMKMEMRSARKPITVKRGSLYHEIVTPTPPREGLADPDLPVQIRTLLSYYNER